MIDELRPFHALSGKVGSERNGDFSPIDPDGAALYKLAGSLFQRKRGKR
jgi:hypothetical protein